MTSLSQQSRTGRSASNERERSSVKSPLSQSDPSKSRRRSPSGSRGDRSARSPMQTHDDVQRRPPNSPEIYPSRPSSSRNKQWTTEIIRNIDSLNESRFFLQINLTDANIHSKSQILDNFSCTVLNAYVIQFLSDAKEQRKSIYSFSGNEQQRESDTIIFPSATLQKNRMKRKEICYL